MEYRRFEHRVFVYSEAVSAVKRERPKMRVEDRGLKTRNPKRFQLPT